jgi:hypothetical protein
MTKYYFPFNDSNFTISDLRKVKTIGDSEFKSLLLYEINKPMASDSRRNFLCLLDGSKIGMAMASMAHAELLYKVPIENKSNNYSNHCVYEIVDRHNFYYPTSEMYELFYGDMNNVENQNQELFDTINKVMDRYKQVTQNSNSIKHAYLLRHYFEEGSCVSTTEYTPLQGFKI